MAVNQIDELCLEDDKDVAELEMDKPGNSKPSADKPLNP